MRYLTVVLGLVALCAIGACDDESDINTDRELVRHGRHGRPGA